MIPTNNRKSGWMIKWALIGVTVLGPTGMAIASGNGRMRLADQLVDDARSIGRNTTIPPLRAASIAEYLLEMAVRLNPKSTTGYRLLAEAAGTVHRPALRVKALLALCKLEPENLVAQLKLVDALAGAKQTVAGRIKIYKAAIKTDGGSKQLGSMLALRIGELYAAQARNTKAASYFVKAVKLDRANVNAWNLMLASLVKNHAGAAQRMYVIVKALESDPFQPVLLEAGAKLLADHRLYAAASSWANQSIQQFQQAREELNPGFAGDLAAFWQMAGKSQEAHAYLSELTALRHPTAATLSLALAAICKGHTATGNLAGLLLQRLESRLKKAIKSNHTPELKADLAWLRLLYAPKLPGDINAQIAGIEKLLGPKNPVYLRIHGWQLMRELYTGAAIAKFKQARSDPYAQIGLAKLMAQGGHLHKAREILQKLWMNAPSTLIALQTFNEARHLDIKLLAPADSATLATIAGAYPKQMLHVLVHPERVVLESIHFVHRTIHAGEPMFARVDYYNASPYTLAVGPTGAITTSVAMVARLEGLTDQNLGTYAVDSDPQIFSLDPNSTLEVSYRLDQGVLRAILQHHPMSMLGGQIEIITNPIVEHHDVFPGLGGQALSAGYFNVNGLAPEMPASLTEMADKFPSFSTANRMLVADIFINHLPRIIKASVSTKAGHSRAVKTEAAIEKVLLDVLSDSDAADLQAWLLRVAPMKGLPKNISSALESLIHSPYKRVRTFAYLRLYDSAGHGAAGTAAAKALISAANTESSRLLKKLAMTLARQAAAIAKGGK
jgi:tetratricopeptide (TPR) repeat protein